MRFLVRVRGGILNLKSSELTRWIGKRVDIYSDGKLVRENIVVNECRDRGYVYGRIRCAVDLPDGTYTIEVRPHVDRELVVNLAYGKFFSFRELRHLVNTLELDEKVELAHKIIEEAIGATRAYSHDVRPLVAFSGGKSSLVMLDLVLHHFDRDEVYVHFANTLNEIPENVLFVRKVVREHFKVRNFIETVPRITPWQIWRTFGFPKVGRRFTYKPACCIVLKELPERVIIAKYGINLDFVGLQFTESQSRAVAISEAGLVRRGTYGANHVTRCFPIALFKDIDLWTYIKRNNLPVNPIYEKYSISRQGCVACTNHVMWCEYIMRINPRIYEFVCRKMREWGVQTRRLTLRQVLNALGIKDVRDAERLYAIRTH